MRGCLKSHPPTPTSTPRGDGTPPHSRKCVAFELEAALETVFIADEWDRTPMEPSKKLSYQDLLELKEIQRSLPRANQPPDLLAGRAGKHYLAGVPIGLLPLLPESDSSPSTSKPGPTTTTTSPSSAGASWMPFNPASPRQPTSPPQRGYNPVFQPPPSSNLHPSNLPPPPPRQKPRFAFLPLLDSPSAEQTSPTLNSTRSRTPSPARSDPPTPSLTYASLESSPMSQSSSCSAEPPMFHLPPPQRRPDFYGQKQTYMDEEDCDSFPRSLTTAMQAMKTQKESTQPSTHNAPDLSALETSKPQWFGRTNPAFRPAYNVPPPPPAPSKPKRQRNVIVVNGIEIDLDGSDDEDEAPTKPSSPIRQPQPVSPHSSPSRSSGPSSPSSITSNGLPTPPPSTSPSPTLPSYAPLPPVEPESSPFVGLHAPVVFKRRVPQPAAPSSMPTVSPSSSPTSQRRGSFCGQQSKRGSSAQGYDPRASPILVPRT